MSQESTSETVHEVQALRHELVDSRKKLQEYADTALHGELRALRGGICKSCKRKFVPAILVSSAAEPVVDSSPLASADSRSSISQTFLSTLPASILSTPITPVVTTVDRNETSILTPVTTTASSEDITQKTVSSFPRWSAERDETANTALNVNIHEGHTPYVRFSADGKYLAAVGENGSIFIYNVDTGDKDYELAEYASQYLSIERPSINCLCFSPNDRYLAVGDVARHVTVWDIPNKRIRNKFRGHKGHVSSVDFSPNCRLVVSATWNGAVCIWNMRDGSAKVFTDFQSFYSVKFNPNGQFVAVGTSRGVLGISAKRTGQLVRKWTGHDATVRGVAFTPDGRGLVSGGKAGVVKRWSVSSLEVVRSGGDPVATKILECKGRTMDVYAVAVSPNSQWIASGLSYGSTVIWDSHSAMQQCTLNGHAGVVLSVDFSPVGGYLAMGSADGHVTLWRYTGT